VLSAASLPVEELVLPEQAPLAADGPQARFWDAGLAGLVLTDTAQFRSPYPEGAADTLDKVDFDRLARVTRLLHTMVASLADGALPRPAPSAPGEDTAPGEDAVPLGEPAPEPPRAAASPGESPGALLPELPQLPEKAAASTSAPRLPPQR
jgi:hypothetical protein